LGGSAAPLPAPKLRGVLPARVEDANALLVQAEFVELDAATSARLAGGTLETVPGESIYLLRGVSWGRHPPHFRKVYVEHATRMVYVVGYTWGGEVLVPFREIRSVASPVIASLPFVPMRVMPKAVLGGDAVFAQARDALQEQSSPGVAR